MINIHNSKYLKGAVWEKDYPQDSINEIVFLGRSNVGKSTFLNKFCKKKNMAHTSSKPGKTQILNFYEINQNLRFVDVPGYGYAKVSKKQRQEFGQMIENYLINRTQLMLAVLLVDFKVGPTEDDILMYNFLKHYQIPVLIVATKQDKIKKSQQKSQQMKVEKMINLAEEDRFFSYTSTNEETLNPIYDYIEGFLDE